MVDRRHNRKLGGIALAALATAAVGAFGFYFLMTNAHGYRSGMAGDPMQHRHGADGQGRDEVNMPGLRSRNAAPEESAKLAAMFRDFETITRSSDQDVRAALVSHVVGMIDRVGRKDDPQIIIQSPTLGIFFERGDEIVSEIEVTDEGIVVVQTAQDPALVEAMHTPAAEVSAMADRGMDAVHEMMMTRG